MHAPSYSQHMRHGMQAKREAAITLHGALPSPCLQNHRTNVIVAGEGRSANRTKWTAPSVTLEGSAATATLAPPASAPSTAPLDVSKLVWQAAEASRPEFDAIDRLVHANLSRVQAAFKTARVGPHHFCGSTGYGHGDLGRAALDDVMAEVMDAEAAAVRIQFVSGTHAIASALYACLRPGDELLAVAGSPYDTLEEVIGLRGTPGSGSLAEFGVSYRKLDLAESGSIDWEGLSHAITPGELSEPLPAALELIYQLHFLL